MRLKFDFRHCLGKHRHKVDHRSQGHAPTGRVRQERGTHEMTYRELMSNNA